MVAARLQTPLGFGQITESLRWVPSYPNAAGEFDLSRTAITGHT